MTEVTVSRSPADPDYRRKVFDTSGESTGTTFQLEVLDAGVHLYVPTDNTPTAGYTLPQRTRALALVPPDLEVRATSEDFATDATIDYNRVGPNDLEEGDRPYYQLLPFEVIRLANQQGDIIQPFDLSRYSIQQARTTQSGAANAAEVNAPTASTLFTTLVDVSGAATVTWEQKDVSQGASWQEVHTETYTEASVDKVNVRSAWQDLRVYADANVNRLALASRGTS